MSILAFRRRCGWCGVQLRGWQLNLCRRCKERTGDAGIYLQSGGPWTGENSRWEEVPDRSRTIMRVRRWQEERPVEFGVVAWTAMMALFAALLTAAGFVFG